MLLKTPTARFVVHVFITAATAFFVAWSAAGESLDKAVLIAALAAAGRAAIGALTSVNPSVGKNIL